MISRKHKCIFIHISKCAGYSVETGFGVNIHGPDYESVFGWCPQRRLYMQHATPQQLLDTGLIDRATWDDYYKFIIVRNPWDRAYSDYFWTLINSQVYGSFKDFIYARGKLRSLLTERSKTFRGDHLYRQVDYFFLDGKPIPYDRVIRFESLRAGLDHLIGDLGLPSSIFDRHKNFQKKNFDHYSHFYNEDRRMWVENKFREDIAFFKYAFEDRRTPLSKLRALSPAVSGIGLQHVVKLKHPAFYARLRTLRKRIVHAFRGVRVRPSAKIMPLKT